MPLSPRSRRPSRHAALAVLAYALITVIATWPLARGLTHDLPGDLGDPLLGTWILAWDADHLLRAAAGHIEVLRDYWNANIFYPHPLALAYSEHLTTQAIEMLPVYALTRNPVLGYNLVFLSTFVLSAFGMFLFAHQLTKNPGAAFIAGLAFAFAPYRIASIPHVQILSSMWMPFAFLGFRRFVETKRTRPLAGGCAAWLAQNLSCGYYLLYFTPVLALYVLWEMTTRRLWTDRKLLLQLSAGCAIVAVLTLPFALPYLHLRQLGFAPRPAAEVARYSADTYSYLTADGALHLWGRLLQGYPTPEGALFPGFTILLLAGCAVYARWRRARTGPHHAPSTTGRIERVVAWSLAVMSGVFIAMLFGWTWRLRAGPIFIRITNLGRTGLVLVGLTTALLALSTRARSTARNWLSSPVGIMAIITILAADLSLGFNVSAQGRLLAGPNLYAALYHYVPGFDGVRAPARFAMIVTLGLAVLSAYGAEPVVRRRGGPYWIVILSVFVLCESFAAPIQINGLLSYERSGLAPLPNTLTPGGHIPPVYEFAALLPSSAVLIELPFGEPDFETRYMFYSIHHQRRLVNGYGGGTPPGYLALSYALMDVSNKPDDAWRALAGAGATHAIVHEGAYLGDGGTRLTEWLRANGARDVGLFGSDRVFEMP